MRNSSLFKNFESKLGIAYTSTSDWKVNNNNNNSCEEGEVEKEGERNALIDDDDDDEVYDLEEMSEMSVEF
ncbi:hypothetical protein PRIPAC_90186 [Pristionchus pacificus]|uniref:Uncharacterized protein n=1 Tax=Pristionchus pacificus TaxID=54126 RepID=A0A2A6B3N3_PRIPA|nr:hypothetical protein PRIPAC_90186 [Pristionchus pacificus]|eukprot:PDM60484.1 hypothetical protein PRIPAC_53462 [Pristionchus pacificus]